MRRDGVGTMSPFPSGAPRKGQRGARRRRLPTACGDSGRARPRAAYAGASGTTPRSGDKMTEDRFPVDLAGQAAAPLGKTRAVSSASRPAKTGLTARLVIPPGCQQTGIHQAWPWRLGQAVHTTGAREAGRAAVPVPGGSSQAAPGAPAAQPSCTAAARPALSLSPAKARLTRDRRARSRRYGRSANAPGTVLARTSMVSRAERTSKRRRARARAWTAASAGSVQGRGRVGTRHSWKEV